MPNDILPKRKKKPKVKKASGAQPIYMYRPVMNAEQLHEWAASQGFKTALLPDDMHITVVFSKAAFSAHYSRLAETNEIVNYSNVVVQGGKRAVVPLGDEGAVVLKIQSDSLQYEHLGFRAEGASWDFQEYTPHITITYNGSDLDPRQMQPFTGDIVLGPLRAKPLNPEWDDEIVEVVPVVTKAAKRLVKRYLNDDSFTTREEAITRSYDLGMEGEIHVHQTADGQATYMPGESHEDYLEAMASAAGLLEPEEVEGEDYEDDEGESGTGLLERAISAILEAVADMEKADMTEDVTKTADILKVDNERRIVWGWASVSTMKGELVTDLQGDTITPQEMEKMADRFMASARTAKAMHEGDQIGEVLHSFPITNEIAKAFGMETDREGWVIGMKIHDDTVWQGFKDGTYKAFSIGGRSKRERIE